jgi:hypothetical protein
MKIKMMNTAVDEDRMRERSDDSRSTLHAQIREKWILVFRREPRAYAREGPSIWPDDFFAGDPQFGPMIFHLRRAY